MKRVNYWSKTGQLCSGYLAEESVSPITQKRIVRITDSQREAKDISAGIWIPMENLVEDK